MLVLLTAVCVLSCFGGGEVAASWDSFSADNYGHFVWNPKFNVCEEAPLGRVPWIIHVRNSDYGWNEHTHRANIALAVNKYHASNEEMTKMEQQLDLEITKALFRNESIGIYDNDLALFIHALIATCRNPFDFHGTNLVADLLRRVDQAIDTRQSVHPFLVLALCNSRVVRLQHLESIKEFTLHDHTRLDLDGRIVELKALALKAYACAADLDRNLDKFQGEMKNAAECLTRRQNTMSDGSFGNVYTTSLAVQALTACKQQPCINTWDESRAREFLLKESVQNVNMIKAYYIEMALNARNATYVKDLCNEIHYPPPPPPPDTRYYVQYTIREDLFPDYYFSLTIRVEPHTNFFDIMTHASKLSDRFRFNFTYNHEQLPMVHRVSGVPNDAEENMFWRICRQTAVDHVIHTSRIVNFHDSPVRLLPEPDEHIILWYRNAECPPK